MNFPNKRYKLILADPPWKYDFQMSNDRKIENHYDTMELEDIMALPVRDIAEENSVLFLWTTAPKLIEGLKVMEAWGFNYRTHAIWNKKIIGTGMWFRGQHEILLLGTIGQPGLPLPANRPSSIFSKQRTEHSEKPKYYYAMLEKMVDGEKIELFARDKRQGWDAWGNQVPISCQNILVTEDA